MTIVYKKIMVTLDGSDFAAQALPLAQMLAKSLNAGLVLFRVVPAMDVLSAPLEIAHAMDERQQQMVNEVTQTMQALAQNLRRHDLRAEAVIEVGNAAEEIIDYAREHNVDLIVMSTHGRSGLARWVYGSVAHKVLQHAPCSVFLARSSPEGSTALNRGNRTETRFLA